MFLDLIFLDVLGISATLSEKRCRTVAYQYNLGLILISQTPAHKIELKQKIKENHDVELMSCMTSVFNNIIYMKKLPLIAYILIIDNNELYYTIILIKYLVEQLYMRCISAQYFQN